ncbi:MAG: hypothetical protein M1491_01660 [Deltaproteobacteria bacterium]|nr:hypothetical protein [Deltaproteobacteria bacterium]MCL5277725.1 hypothetical protein [Deltaproteobacteria bacterium]
MKMKRYLRCVGVVGLISIAGCINVSEDIVLNLGGSGSLHLVYSIPEALMKDQQGLHNAMTQTGIMFPLTKKDFDNQFAGLEGVHVRGVKTYTDNGYYEIDGRVKFADINALKMSNVRFVLRKSGTDSELVISLINSMNKRQAPGQDKARPRAGINYENILKGSLTNYGIKIEVSFPTKVLSANGKIQGRDVKWDVPMNVFLNSEAKEMDLHAVYSGKPTILDRIKDFFR